MIKIADIMPRKPRKWARIIKGHLYGWRKDKADSTRQGILNKAVKKDSYATIIRRLNQLKNVTKDKATKAIAKKDMEYLKKRYKK